MSRSFVVSLSSGGSLGYAHIGVLQAFVETGIDVKAIAGSSMGGIVGSLYALGMLPHEIEDIFARHISDTAVLFSTLMLHLGVWFGPLAYLLDKLRHITIGMARIPLFIYATDMYRGEPYVFQKDESLAVALRSTMAIPGVFPPVLYKGMYLVDGGVSMPLPVDKLIATKTDDDIVVCVDVYGGVKSRSPSVFHAYTTIMSRYGRCMADDMCQYTISPHLEGYTNTMYSHVSDIVERGYMGGISFLEHLYKDGVI